MIINSRESYYVSAKKVRLYTSRKKKRGERQNKQELERNILKNPFDPDGKSIAENIRAFVSADLWLSLSLSRAKLIHTEPVDEKLLHRF